MPEETKEDLIQGLQDAVEQGQEELVPETEGKPESEKPEVEKPEVEEADETEGADETTPSIEELAREMGWKPKDDFVGHEDDYVDAAEYIRRSKDIQDSMRQHLKTNKRQMAAMEKAVEDLRKHNEIVTKANLKDLKARVEKAQSRKEEAIEDGDVDEVKEAEKEISELYKEVVSYIPKQDQNAQVNPDHQEAFDKWIHGNSWYNFENYSGGDPELTDYANYLSMSPKYANMDYEETLEAVGKQVRETFPHKFQKSKKAPPAVEAGGPRKSGSKKPTRKDLSPEQLAVAKNFESLGIKKVDEYVKELSEIGEI